MEKKLKADWSPEQISCHLRLHGELSISHETIYTLSIIIICPGLDSRPGLPSSTCWRAWSAREGRC